MKKTYLILFLFFTAIAIQAANSNLFSYDSEALNNEFMELYALEEFVNSNENISLSELQSANANIISNLNLNMESSMATASSFDGMDWGAFFWGFCCQGCGVIIVTLQKDKRTETRLVSSIIGMGVITAISIIVNIARIAVLLDTYY